MQVQQVSFKSNLATQNNQQKIGLSQVASHAVVSSTQEPHKTNENKVLKYSLIGAGALVAIVAMINHKKIGTLFNISEVKNAPKEILKSPLVSLSEIKKPNGERFIEDCSEGYKLWHFASKDFMQKFVELHEDLSTIAKSLNICCDNFNDIRYRVNMPNNPKKEKLLQFIKLTKEKTGVDLLNDEIKHYRFIGQSELNVIKARKPITNDCYITLCPDGGHTYNIIPAKTDYRLTYKNTPNIIDNLYPYHDTAYKTWTQKPYDYKDVEKVEKLVDGKWQEVKF